MSLLRTLQKSTAQIALRLQRSAAATQIRMQSDAASPAVADAQGSEVAKVPVKEVVTADVVSGAPGENHLQLLYIRRILGPLSLTCGIAELRHRQVRIYKPSSNTMQSGGAKSSRWRIDFDILQGQNYPGKHPMIPSPSTPLTRASQESADAELARVIAENEGIDVERLRMEEMDREFARKLLAEDGGAG